jgi:hypothetical protein
VDDCGLDREFFIAERAEPIFNIGKALPDKRSGRGPWDWGVVDD